MLLMFLSFVWSLWFISLLHPIDGFRPHVPMHFTSSSSSSAVHTYDSALNVKQSSSSVKITPEFSRIIHVDKLPAQRPVLCKLLAKESERAALCERFELPELAYFSANVTLIRSDRHSINIDGKLEAHIQAGEFNDIEILTAEFDTLVLNNYGAAEAIDLDEAADYDDEVSPTGDIDIGEVAAQYLALELY